MLIQSIPPDKLQDIVGHKLEPGAWVTVDQERINTFADCTEDHQFIHVDPKGAAQTPFGGTIAHGFLSLSLLVKLCEGRMVIPEGTVMGMNYGFNKIRFLAPIRAGKRVRTHSEINSIEPKEGNRFLVTQTVTVEIEGEDKPALVAEWLNMIFTA